MKIGILISGRGSNMVALVDAVKSGEIPASEVPVVISDKANAPGLEKARERGVETAVIERSGRSREEHDSEIAAKLKEKGVELICLAGYMRLLSPEFVRLFPDRIINIHPSLLPAFPGLDAQKQALEAGVKTTGCTVHYVNEDLDAGRIILQRAVEVKNGDTAETLTARILDEEHKAYVEAVSKLVIERSCTQPELSHQLFKILKVGLDTSMRGEGISLRDALQRVNYFALQERFSASDLLPLIRENPSMIDEWVMYSEDKRTDGGWWISVDPPFIKNLKSPSAKLRFDSIEEAVAEYVKRELDFWANLNPRRVGDPL